MRTVNQEDTRAVDSISMAAGTKSLETPRNHLASTRFLRLPEVMAATGLRKTKIYELVAAGDFPQQVKITAHSVGWVEAEIQAWQACRIALRMSHAVATQMPL